MSDDNRRRFRKRRRERLFRSGDEVRNPVDEHRDVVREAYSFAHVSFGHAMEDLPQIGSLLFARCDHRVVYDAGLHRLAERVRQDGR